MTGLDKLFSGMRASVTGLTAERARINVIAENIANARTTRTPEGGPYRRKLVVFEPLVEKSRGGGKRFSGVQAMDVIEDSMAPFETVLDPGHPDANADGMVTFPNVNTVLEMTDLISAMRSYEANLTAQENFMRLAERALDLLR